MDMVVEVVGALTAAHGPRGHGGSGLATDKGAEAGHILAVCVTGDRTHALTAEGCDASEDGTGRGTPIVAFTCKDDGGDAGPVSPTLRAMGHGASHQNAGGQVAVAFPANLSGTQRVGSVNVSPALGAKNPTAVAFALRGREAGAVPEVHEAGDTVGALRAAEGGSSRDYLAFGGNNQSGPIDVAPAILAHDGGSGYKGDFESETFLADGWRVRRLTPTECERLQAFPDGYTDVPLGNRPMADGPRYNMLGDSMATVVLVWIADALEAALLA